MSSTLKNKSNKKQFKIKKQKKLIKSKKLKQLNNSKVWKGVLGINKMHYGGAIKKNSNINNRLVSYIYPNAPHPNYMKNLGSLNQHLKGIEKDGMINNTPPPPLIPPPYYEKSVQRVENMLQSAKDMEYTDIINNPVKIEQEIESLKAFMKGTIDIAIYMGYEDIIDNREMIGREIEALAVDREIGEVADYDSKVQVLNALLRYNNREFDKRLEVLDALLLYNAACNHCAAALE